MMGRRKVIGVLFVILILIAVSAGLAVTQLFNSEVVSLDAQQAKELIEKKPDLVIVDVRELSEYQEGHIPGAILISLSVLEENLNKLKKDEAILLVCKSGIRSMRAGAILIDNGYMEVYSLSGGISGWPYEFQKGE